MKNYTISNPVTGIVLGSYTANDETHAIDQLMTDSSTAYWTSESDHTDIYACFTWRTIEDRYEQEPDSCETYAKLKITAND